MEVLRQAVDVFTIAIAVAPHGGRAATADKNQKRHELIGLLRKLGHYVQVQCNNDMSILLSSGFAAQNPLRTQTPLSRPSILRVENGMSTELKLRVAAIPNAKMYEVRIAAVGADGVQGPWQSAGFSANSRAIPVVGLTPGIVYWMQVRALGGSTGSSDWSDPVSRMSL